MEFDHLTLLLFFAILAVAVSFACSLAEAVLLSITPAYIASKRTSDPKLFHLLDRLKTNIDRPLAAILTLNTVAHTVGATGVGAEAVAIWGNQAIGIVSAVMTLVILFLSEIIPKTIGAEYWKPLAPFVGRALQWLVTLTLPFIWISDRITKTIKSDTKHGVSREEVEALADLGHKSGSIALAESRILRNLLKLPSLTTADIMTPRTVLIAFPEVMTVGEVLDDHPDLPVSRLPVYESNIDQVSGFVTRDDLLKLKAEGKANLALVEIRREVSRIPASAPLTKLFDLFLNRKQQIALVIDEYGGTHGVVTMEDLVETLLGAEIVDEADTDIDMRDLARKRWQKRMVEMGINLDRAVSENSD